MKGLVSCTLCALYLGLGMFIGRAFGADFKRRDGIHRLEKAHVTAFHDLNRRDPICATGYSACDSGLNGGCCESGYACATDSCYATTSAPRTCRGMVGYYHCDGVMGGGCCPEGYICERGNNCVAASGVAYSQSCPASYYLCPASLSYGCCRDGLGCAVSACYSTDPSTYTITTTITTTNDVTQVITTTMTATTVLIPSRPTVAPTAVATMEAGDPNQVVLKFYPSTVPKQQPISGTGNSDNKEGLTTGQIAGIIAGGGGLLIVVLVAAWIIIRHLNKVVQAVETSNKGTSSGGKSRPSMYQFKPTPSEVDDMSVDPLMMSPRPSHRRHDSDTTADFTPPYRGTPGSAGDYQPVPQGTGTDRHASYDSAYAGSYFDVPDQSHRNSLGSSAWIGLHRGSTDSQGTYAHLRHWSNASEVSSDHGSGGARTPLQELDSTPYVPELAATPVPDAAATEARRRSAGSLSGMSRPPAVHQRRRSSDGGHGRARSDSSAAVGLSVVSEDTELIGHYGPSDRATGQTSTRKEGH